MSKDDARYELELLSERVKDVTTVGDLSDITEILLSDDATEMLYDLTNRDES